jgi:putative transposase
MNRLYALMGISKQGFHQWLNREMKRKEEQMQLLPVIRQIREDHPRLSSREIYPMVSPRYMGRDRFLEFCYDQGLKIQPLHNHYRTTNSNGVIRFPNLLLELDELTSVNQVWVSDISYYQVGKELYYLTFMTDLYNREIVGYTVSKSLMTVDTTLKALKKAIKNRKITKGQNLVLHSDGGGQYYSKEFLALTGEYQIRNSMGKTAYENPHAERVNGTIKNDYLIPYAPENYSQLVILLTKAVNMYNQHRPHHSLGGHTPKEFGELTGKKLLTKIWVINKRKKVTKKEKVNIIIK